MNPEEEAGVSETIEIRTGFPTAVGDGALVTVMGVEPPRVLLGVDEPDGSRTTEWYSPGDELVAGGRRWRVTSTHDIPLADPGAPPGASGGHTAAVLERQEAG